MIKKKDMRIRPSTRLKVIDVDGMKIGTVVRHGFAYQASFAATLAAACHRLEPHCFVGRSELSATWPNGGDK